MKKLFSLVFLFIIAIGMASAIVECEEEVTTVGGIIYQDTITNKVAGADVIVTCHHDGSDYTKTTTSNFMGKYAVYFDEDECDHGDTVTVSATSDGLAGENDGSISHTYELCCLTLNVGIVNVPLIPEFGVFVGALTLLSALGVFFVIRRR
jgi:hypothetical protein